MRVVYVTGALPYPLTSGRLRHYYLVRELARRHHDVLLVALNGATATADHVAQVAHFATVRLEGDRLTRSRRVGRALGWADPGLLRLAADIQQLVHTGQVDVVVLAVRPPLALLANLAHRVPLVVDMCDAETLHLERRARIAPARQRLRLMLHHRFTRRREQAVIRLSDAVLFATMRDQQDVLSRDVLGAAAYAGAQPAIVSNGIDIDQWRRRQPQLGREVVFSGAMDYGPNTDAAIQLVDVILPLVRQTLPETQVRIVGRDPPPELLARGRVSGVTVTGFVEDMRPHLEKGAVFAAPLRYGAGIQNKLLEAMAMELPCVATALAASGLETGRRQPPIEVASDPREFATRLVRRIEAAAHDPSPHAAARAYVAEHFSWAAAGVALEQVLVSVRQRGRAT